MKKGYKETELGYIPVEWELKKINDFTDFVGSGVTPKGGQSVYKKDGIPFIRSQNVYPDGLHLDEVVFIDNEQNNKMKRTEFKENDVLLNITGASIGRCTYVPQGFGKGNVNQHVCIIRADNTVNPVYLSMYINSSIVQKQIDALNTGSSREGLNFQQVRGLKVCLMGIKEQQKIADILSTVDLQIDYAVKIIEKTRKLKKGLMQRLLTKGIGHKEFKKSEVGDIPVEWEVKALNNIIEDSRKITYGIVQPGEFDDEGRYLIRAKDYSFGWVKLEQIFRVSDFIEEPYKRARVKENDILFTIVGSVGNVALVPKYLEGSNITQQTARISIDESCGIKMFYYYFIQSEIINKQTRAFLKTGVQPSINLSDLAKFKIVIPPLEEQIKIANILSSIDCQIEGYENKKVKLEELKKGLMQQLLTGKIRVK